MKRILTVVCGLAALAAPVAAQAHVLGAGGAGLAEGLAHPIAGIDHLLAILAVGWWAAQGAGHRRWLAPACFLLALLVGAAVAGAGLALPHAEAVIAASLLGLGGMVALRVGLPLSVGVTVIAAFALFHGHAHGGEMPAAASPLLYGLGFAVTTAALLAAATGVAVAVGRPWLVRAAGAATAAVGLVLVAG